MSKTALQLLFPGVEFVFTTSGHHRPVPLPLLPGEAIRLAYTRQHVPTGNRYPTSDLFTDRHAFRCCLRKWNRMCPDMWQYDGDMDGPTMEERHD